MSTTTKRVTAYGQIVETETFIFDDSVIIDYKHLRDDGSEIYRISESLNVGNLKPFGDGEDLVSIRLSSRKEFDDNSTDFTNFSEALYVTREQALAFAYAIIKECA